MEHTGNFQLSQWESTDRIQRQDFNADNAKIDAALAAHAAAITRRGNCRLVTFTYTGTGECGEGKATTITFPGQPDFFIVFGSQSIAMAFWGEARILSLTYTSGQSYSFGGSTIPVTWSGNQMILQTTYMESQLNTKNAIYHVAAFYKMD